MGRTDYLERNALKNDFVDNLSRNTGDMLGEQWLPTLKANRKFTKQYGWACEAFQGSGKDKATVVMGASPAINKQIPQIKALSHDPDFILIAVSSLMKLLCENDIKPKFVFIAEVREVVLEWFKGVTEEWMQDVTLIVDTHTNPKVMDVWKGDVKFLATYSAVKNLDKKTKRWMFPVNGIDAFFPALGAQHGSATAFSSLVLESPVTIFVGSEFGFPSADPKDRYYANRDDSKDHFERWPHTDIYGGVAYTTFVLLQNKYVLEDWCGKMPGYFFNATEAGILGVDGCGEKAKHLPWIHQFHLNTAIAQAKHILRTGEPLAETKRTEQKTAQYEGVKAPFEIRRE